MALASSRAIAPAAAQLAVRTRHHIALRLLPFLFVLYIINYLDRTSVAYAAIGMSRELGFSDRVVGMGVGVFFISYVALQIPGAVLVERWSARKMISATMISWGLNTIASQFQDRVAEYGIMLQRASTDREGGWQLIYRMLKSGELVICGDTCPELVKAIPTRLHDLKKPGDIIKTPGDHHDDEVDAFRYAIYSFVTASDVHKPVEIRLAEAMQKYDATTLAMKHYQIIREAQSEQQPTLYSRNALTSFGKSRGTAGDSRTTETK